MAEEGPVPGRGPTSTRPLRPMTPRTDGPRWGEDYPSQRGQGRSSWTGGVSDDRSFRGEQRGGRNSPGGGRRSEGTRRYGDSEFRGQSRGSTSLRRRDEDEAPKPPPYDGDHLYGISPVRLALTAMKRNISELLVQEGMDLAEKKDEKTVREIFSAAQSNGIPVTHLSKHDLNMLCDNRPHQGFILRAKPLEFSVIEELSPTSEFQCVLALDEVWDPQNFGALLRTAHFLACDRVVVCAKNSAPLSPTVSKASSGAMELMDIGSTSNMMRFLDRSRANGWQVVGTSLSDKSIDILDAKFDQPTILVLGNEGFGMRTNIVNRCDVLVKIMGGTESSLIDSLNVSVTGGILLHRILGGRLGK